MTPVATALVVLGIALMASLAAAYVALNWRRR